MAAFLERFAKGLPERVHVALLLDGAGWHTAMSFAVPDNISLVFLPPYSPDLNRVEKVWQLRSVGRRGVQRVKR